VARVVAFIPDLLFGSNVIGALQAAGHDPVMVSRGEDLKGALPGADVLVVDLTDDVPARIESARGALTAGDHRPRTLAFFSHVEADVRAEAQRAGFDLVVPRSRMARATADLISQLTG
jgi:uncharacterized protein YbjT (DUF2867 family)